MTTTQLPSGVAVNHPDFVVVTTERPVDEAPHVFDRVLGPALERADVRVLTQATLTAEPHRGGGGPSGLSFEVDAGDDDAMVLVDEDGMLRWLIEDRQTRSAGGRRVFEYQPVGPTERGPGTLFEKIRVWFVKFVVRRAAGWTAQLAVRAIEAPQRNGLVHVDGPSLDQWHNLESLAELALPNRQAKVLLLLHGTFSSTRGSFAQLCSGAATALRGWLHEYDAVLGFDHHTLSRGPEENAADVCDALRSRRWSHDVRLDIVGFSRGGLVARCLVEQVLPGSELPVSVRNVVAIGSTSAGTVLAARKNWKAYLDLVTNLLAGAGRLGSLLDPQSAAIAAGVASTMIGLTGFAKALAAYVLNEDDVPGISAMAPDGALVEALNRGPAPQVGRDVRYHLVHSDFRASITDGLAGERLPAKVVRWFVDTISGPLFQGQPNDMVVDNESTVTVHPELGERVRWVGLPTNSKIHHLNFLVDPRTRTQIASLASFSDVSQPTVRGELEAPARPPTEELPRPPLMVVTTMFTAGREETGEGRTARELGTQLYAWLTRPPGDTLGQGLDTPVRVALPPQELDPSAAERMLVLAVLGEATPRDELVRLRDWRDAGVKVRGVALTPEWRDRLVEQGLDVVENLDAPTLLREVLTLVEDDEQPVDLHVMHSLDEQAETVANALMAQPGRGWFERRRLGPGAPAPDRRERAVLVYIWTDSPSGRVAERPPFETAKRAGIPIVIVEMPARQPSWRPSHASNLLVIDWTNDAEAVLNQARIEWLRHALFRVAAPRVARLAGLPEQTLFLSRPPEAGDVIEGELRHRTSVVMHPDPQMPFGARRRLNAIRPGLRVTTPTGAFQRILGRNLQISETVPLTGTRVALSLSNEGDGERPPGLTSAHVVDATVHLARTLVAAGAALAYGGDFRPRGYDHLLIDLIEDYNATSSAPSELLHSYVPASTDPSSAPAEVTVHHRSTDPDLKTALPDPVPPVSEVDRAIYVSEMRLGMARGTHARVVVGGQGQPRTGDEPGYGGRFPGIIEEAWRTLQAERPLYVVGGFGGAAGLLAEVMLGGVPDALRDETHRRNPDVMGRFEALSTHPGARTLGLPGSLEAMVDELRHLSRPLFESDATSLALNGLTVAQNRALLTSTDPIVIATLVVNGMTRVTRGRRQAHLPVELVAPGRVHQATGLDAIVVATFDDVPLDGSLEVLDRELAGRMATMRQGEPALFDLRTANVDAEWLYLHPLHLLRDGDPLPRIRKAAEEAARQCIRHGFRRIGVTTFGGRGVTEVGPVVDAMMSGFDELRIQETTIVWFEDDLARADEIGAALVRPAVRLTRLEPTRIPGPEQAESLVVHVSRTEQGLDVTTMPPAARGVPFRTELEVTPDVLDALCEGRGSDGRDMPELEALDPRGAQLAKLLFGEQCDSLLELARRHQVPVVVVHDTPCSRLPFELLCSEQDPRIRPALVGGLSRRLSIDDVWVDPLFPTQPASGRLRVLLVVNPKTDEADPLPGTETEAEQVRRIVAGIPDVEIFEELWGPDATPERVRDHLPEADVLHYAGHAFYEGPHPHQSGLLLAGENGRFTVREMRYLRRVPRLVFANACESARVRRFETGNPGELGRAFAEVFLRGRSEAYVGTNWLVEDGAAGAFAATLYARLAEGRNLAHAVRSARYALHQNQHEDWANYVFYGNGGFRLTVQRATD